MQLIGSLDSPYVRRVAISLNSSPAVPTPLGLGVSRLDEFSRINPGREGTDLVCDDGGVLMD